MPGAASPNARSLLSPRFRRRWLHYFTIANDKRQWAKTRLSARSRRLTIAYKKAMTQEKVSLQGTSIELCLTHSRRLHVVESRFCSRPPALGGGDGTDRRFAQFVVRIPTRCKSHSQPASRVLILKLHTHRIGTSLTYSTS